MIKKIIDSNGEEITCPVCGVTATEYFEFSGINKNSDLTVVPHDGCEWYCSLECYDEAKNNE